MPIAIELDEGDVCFAYVPADSSQAVLADVAAVKPMFSDFFVLVVGVRLPLVPPPTTGLETLCASLRTVVLEFVLRLALAKVLLTDSEVTEPLQPFLSFDERRLFALALFS
ncbi:MAG TPA: hypothetical protein VFG04_03845 [Planctomycetaceae bacterium]|nr:hypothetical protein [Planctomycetaceae bacterium]